MGIGVQNNNPGCIRSGKGYAKYATMEEGYTALNSLLYRRYDRMTLREMFSIYAPSSDGGNNPSQYARNVLAHLKKEGYDIDFSTRLDFSDPEFRAAMTMAISKEENGSVLGGEELALKAARNYNPSQDTKTRYSRTESRRKKYGNIQMKRKEEVSEQKKQQKEVPSLLQRLRTSSIEANSALNDVLKEAGDRASNQEGVSPGRVSSGRTN